MEKKKKKKKLAREITHTSAHVNGSRKQQLSGGSSERLTRKEMLALG